ncbi:hypothetical protein [Comamonas sp. C11]|uniref:hypothetical protein n=1 Tax=Comamonas sp. C11 TaxID=2966554 RepID=UPI0021135E86|nr:hypothetical protein [Comamonas sp. C11]UUC92743.1 hypothetical protein NOX35_21100 [Comamonas sp. C11]
MSQSDGRRSDWGLGSRLAAAVLGGYAVSSAWVILCGAMSQSRVETILAGMQSSWLWYVAAVIWAFSPASPRRIWSVLGIVMIGMLLGTAALIFLKGR